MVYRVCNPTKWSNPKVSVLHFLLSSNFQLLTYSPRFKFLNGMLVNFDKINTLLVASQENELSYNGKVFLQVGWKLFVEIKLRKHLFNLNGFKKSKLINISQVRRVYMYRSYPKMMQASHIYQILSYIEFVFARLSKIFKHGNEDSNSSYPPFRAV